MNKVHSHSLTRHSKLRKAGYKYESTDIEFWNGQPYGGFDK